MPDDPNNPFTNSAELARQHYSHPRSTSGPDRSVISSTERRAYERFRDQNPFLDLDDLNKLWDEEMRRHGDVATGRSSFGMGFSDQQFAMLEDEDTRDFNVVQGDLTNPFDIGPAKIMERPQHIDDITITSQRGLAENQYALGQVQDQSQYVRTHGMDDQDGYLSSSIDQASLSLMAEQNRISLALSMSQQVNMDDGWEDIPDDENAENEDQGDLERQQQLQEENAHAEVLELDLTREDRIRTDESMEEGIQAPEEIEGNEVSMEAGEAEENENADDLTLADEGLSTYGPALAETSMNVDVLNLLDEDLNPDDLALAETDVNADGLNLLDEESNADDMAMAGERMDEDDDALAEEGPNADDQTSPEEIMDEEGQLITENGRNAGENITSADGEIAIEDPNGRDTVWVDEGQPEYEDGYMNVNDEEHIEQLEHERQQGQSSVQYFDDFPSELGIMSNGSVLPTSAPAPKRVQRLSKVGVPVPSLPATLQKNLIHTFSRSRISREAMEVIQEGSHQFLEQVAGDLAAYAAHAGRRTIDGSDVECLMQRLRITNNKVSIESLLQRYLPRELRDKVLYPEDLQRFRRQ
ncbi:centromere kinetochore component CENP-T-domain-containing protein [Gamsiella multidivaricata]|uniref:centromere kinetochore component CENP-T-domain-containing protein n=1 Tax=Gamsiella multidivaricata TaxID=101098 RepID=UPI002220F452|nr:centromere kinetochore component CENP-T-domain-containing protein [Gamsiella multidivaricata]KAI7817025.1 centromere kinetochore component CENP-T-domain-containing protein [Gamsiella multidivaricata]